MREQYEKETETSGLTDRFFGKAKDSHPNIEVIEMLQKENIRIVVTNDVIKNNVPIVNKKDNLDDKMIKVID